MSSLAAEHLSVVVGEASLVKDVSISVAPGELVAILGSNGAGKSTLIKALAGLLTPAEGYITADGADLTTMTPPDRARVIGYLPQQRPTAWPIRVRDVVTLGMCAWGALPGGALSADNARLVDEVIAECSLRDLADRGMDTLSGGEATRVHCARAFATGAPVLLADEPTTALDPRHQLTILSLIRARAAGNRSAIVVLHEPALAARFADRLVWMKDGRIIADGSPDETLTPDLMAEIYGVEAIVTRGPGNPVIDIVRPI